MYLKMNKLLLFCMLLMMTSCVEDAKILADTPSSQEKINDKNAKEITFQSVSFVADWPEIEAFKEELERVALVSVLDVKDIEALVNKMDLLKGTCPEALTSNAIAARLKVLQTKTAMLSQYVASKQLIEVNICLKEVILAYKILITQIERHIVKNKDYESYSE